jgi:hypothetical protein
MRGIDARDTACLDGCSQLASLPVGERALWRALQELGDAVVALRARGGTGKRGG